MIFQRFLRLSSLLIYGLILASICGCGCDSGDNGTDKDGPGLDPGIQASLISAAEAFGTGEPARFAPWLSLNLPVPDGAAPIPLEDAKKVGQAMKAATLIYASKYYAFFEMTIDGRNYPLTLVQEEQGQWKIDQI